MRKIAKVGLVKIGLLVVCLFVGNPNIFGGSEVVFLDEKPDLYILSIGINDYQDKNMKLRYSINDAVELSSEFEKRGKYKFGEIKKVVLTDKDATKQGILNELDNLSREMGSKDVFIFTFAGMGSHFVKDGRGEFYLLPQEADWKNVTEKGISNFELQSYFRKIRAEKKLIILDACESSSGFETAMNTFFETDENLKSGEEETLFIGSDAITYEDPDLEHGVMSAVVLDAIKGKADFDQDDEISFREIEFYMYVGAKKHNATKSAKLSPRTVLRGKDFTVSDTDKKMRQAALQLEKDKKKDQQAKNQNKKTRKVEAFGQEDEPKNKEPEPWKGKSYAVIFANQDYADNSYDGLKNPYNDANDLKKELEENYGFEVKIEKDLTTKQIYDAIKQYQNVDEKKYNFKEDQILFFFAGHGLTHQISPQAYDGYYVGKDSPYPFSIEESGKFVRLDWVVNMIEGLPFNHAMVVFDACYAGKIWTPKVLPQSFFGYKSPKKDEFTASLFQSVKYTKTPTENNLDDDSLIRAKELMKNRTRLSITSGAEPVLDSWEKEDGSLSDNSPFADAFLSALRDKSTRGYIKTSDLMSEFENKRKNLATEPQVGKIGSNSDGDFVFVRREKTKEDVGPR